MSDLPDTLTVQIDGEDRELFISYGLLATLSRLIGDEKNIALISFDDDIRDHTLKAVLAERTKGGKIIKPVEDVFDVNISVKDVNAILTWVTEHLLDFFVQSLERTQMVLKEQVPSLEAG